MVIATTYLPLPGRLMVPTSPPPRVTEPFASGMPLPEQITLSTGTILATCSQLHGHRIITFSHQATPMASYMYGSPSPAQLSSPITAIFVLSAALPGRPMENTSPLLENMATTLFKSGALPPQSIFTPMPTSTEYSLWHGHPPNSALHRLASIALCKSGTPSVATILSPTEAIPLPYML